MALPIDAVAVSLRTDLLDTYGKLLLYLIYENKKISRIFHNKTFVLYLFMIIHVSVCIFTFMNGNVCTYVYTPLKPLLGE